MRKLIVAGIVLAMAVMGLNALADDEQRWTFSGIGVIEIDGTSGDVTVKRADGKEVIVVLDERVEPADAFRGKVTRKGNRLLISEDWHGRNTHGHVAWTIYIPAGDAPLLKVDTASGDLEARDVPLRVNFETASGDIS